MSANTGGKTMSCLQWFHILPNTDGEPLIVNFAEIFFFINAGIKGIPT